MYRFYAFPDRERFRLSQIVVLHPFRRRGLAAAMLSATRQLCLRCGAVRTHARFHRWGFTLWGAHSHATAHCGVHTRRWS